MAGKTDLALGDKLYRRVPMSGIWEYEVMERRETPEGFQYVVRSLACTHGWKCELLIGEDDNGDLRYIHMVNNREEDDQSYWHNPGERFCRTKAQAKVDAYRKIEKEAHERVLRVKQDLAESEKRLKEVSELVAMALSECEEVRRG